MIKHLRRFFFGAKLYRDFKCPECAQPFTPVHSHHPEAPGSGEALHCFSCVRSFSLDRHRKGARVERVPFIMSAAQKEKRRVNQHNEKFYRGQTLFIMGGFIFFASMFFLD